MEEFAEVSGISRPTVSKYFHDPDSVRKTTRSRIENALELYDYTPNIFAINQNRKLTKYIGVVVPNLADPFFAEIARNIERRCMDAGFSPTLFGSHGDPELETEILDNLRLLKPAGVLIAPLGRATNRKALEAFCRDVPTVLFDSNLDGMGEAFIGSDNYSFVSQTVEYLSKTGEPPCFFEMRHPANPNANKRRQAYIKTMTALGHEPQIVQIDGEGWAFEEIGRQGGLKAIRNQDLPSSTVLCSNDRLAIGFLSACYESGLRVGSGEGCALRVASHDDHPYSRFTCPALTTAAHDYDSVSQTSVETLMSLIESGERFGTRPATLYPAKLILRASA
jgi:DNA-binding LacI/PurR family transcriptional regulator